MRPLLEEVQEAWMDHQEHCSKCDAALMSDELCSVGSKISAELTELRFE